MLSRHFPDTSIKEHSHQHRASPPSAPQQDGLWQASYTPGEGDADCDHPGPDCLPVTQRRSVRGPLSQAWPCKHCRLRWSNCGLQGAGGGPRCRCTAAAVLLTSRYWAQEPGPHGLRDRKALSHLVFCKSLHWSFFIGQRNGGSSFMEKGGKVRGSKLPLMMPCALEQSTHTHTHTLKAESTTALRLVLALPSAALLVRDMSDGWP